jgi:hypothetical protein
MITFSARYLSQSARDVLDLYCTHLPVHPLSYQSLQPACAAQLRLAIQLVPVIYGELVPATLWV